MVIYVDENLHGRRFVDILRRADIDVRTCGEEGFSGAPDEEWIPEIARRGWVIVTGDIRTRFVGVERTAIVASRAMVVYLRRGKQTTHTTLARNFVNTFARLERYALVHDPPWLVTLTRPHDLKDIESGRPGRLNPQPLG